MNAPERLPLQMAWRYAWLGWPLAFAALPVYVHLPHWYAQNWGLSLTALGLVLMGSRLLDAFWDPWLGRVVDAALQSTNPRHPWILALLGACALSIGFFKLWQPWLTPSNQGLFWFSLVLNLALTYLGYSLLSLLHQAWGTRWGGDQSLRAQVSAWREGAALLGVLLASGLPAWLGMQWLAPVLIIGLLPGIWLLLGLSRHLPVQRLELPAVLAPAQGSAHVSVWRTQGFSPLLLVYGLNGIASAIPATLLPFFVADVLQDGSWQGGYLSIYFLAAAISVPIWTYGARRWSLQRLWALSMVMSILAFVFALSLQAHDRWGFVAVCLLTGFCFGGDVVAPSALLTGLIHRQGLGNCAEGRFLGWWALVSKMNLALAAGLALPMLEILGYSPSSRNVEGLNALSWAYVALPCALKVLALWQLRRLHMGMHGPVSPNLS